MNRSCVSSPFLKKSIIGTVIAGRPIDLWLPPELMLFCPLIAVVAAALFILVFSLTETDGEIISKKTVVDVELGANASLSEHAQSSADVLKSMEEETTAQTAKKKTQQVPFINNIKIFLTCVVRLPRALFPFTFHTRFASCLVCLVALKTVL